jgi:hypothetical protein
MLPVIEIDKKKCATLLSVKNVFKSVPRPFSQSLLLKLNVSKKQILRITRFRQFLGINA